MSTNTTGSLVLIPQRCNLVFKFKTRLTIKDWFLVNHNRIARIIVKIREPF